VLKLPNNNRELWAAFFAVILIAAVYLFTMSQMGGVPAASGLFGHGLGILGFILMLMTEFLYSWRKRSRSARWGRMSSWLRFHIFTGLVGPFMVLLHSSWKFNGLAGIVMLLTVVIVISGIIGRYIYTAIPRTAEGTTLESSELAHQIAAIENQLQQWRDSQPEVTRALTSAISDENYGDRDPILVLLGRTISEIRIRFKVWQARRQLRSRYKAKAGELAELLRRKRTLQRQISSLILARRLLSIWHAVHIPIGVALFSTAFVHLVGAIYYATLLR
jgi:hypothetical protein